MKPDPNGLIRPLAALLIIAATTLVMPRLAALPALASQQYQNAPESEPTFQDQLMELVNQARWENGNLPPLKRVELLDTAAGSHASNMAGRDFFDHCDLDTKESPWDRMLAAGYQYDAAAENIAAGYTSPATVMNGWMGSSGHRSNLLSTSMRELGIGYSLQTGDQGNVRRDQNGDCNADNSNAGPYLYYWTLNFGRRNAVYPLVINREAHETTSRAVMLFLYGQGWAEEMRFRNEAGAWSDWEPFAADVPWTLSAGGGLKTVQAEIRAGASVYSASDAIWLDEPVLPSPTPGPTATPFPWLNPLFLPTVLRSP